MLYFCYVIIHDNSCDSFTHIFQGYFTGTGAIIWLPRCQWSNPEGYVQNQLVLHSLRSGDAYVSLSWAIIVSGNGLLPVRCQAITWTNDDSYSIELLQTMFSWIFIEIKIFSLMKLSFAIVVAKPMPGPAVSPSTRTWCGCITMPNMTTTTCISHTHKPHEWHTVPYGAHRIICAIWC